MQRTETQLSFYLGEFRVYSASLRVALEPFSFSREPLGPDFWPEPLRDEKLAGYYFPSVPADEELPLLSIAHGFIRYVPSRFRRHYVDLSGDIDSYVQGFSSKTRSTLRRKVRKFTELNGGELKWREYASADEMEEFYRLARAVSRKTYQERLLSAGLPETDEFIEDMLVMARENRVRGFLLFLHGDPVSYLYLSSEGDRLIYTYLGYDPEHAKISPGTVLQLVALERLFEERSFRYLDFTEGGGEQKRLFGTDWVHCADVYFLLNTLGNRLLVEAHRELTRASAGIVALLDQIGLKQAVKQWIRSHA